MKITAVRKGGNKYLVNNIVVKANTSKEAIAAYVSQTMAGSKIQLSKG